MAAAPTCPPAAQALVSLTVPWHLAVVSGPDAGAVLALPAHGTLVLGRGEVLTDPFASRRQLAVQVLPEKVVVSPVACSVPPLWRRRRLGPLLLPAAGRLRRGSVWRESERLQVGTSRLELRRRPSRLCPAVPAPATGSPWWRLLAAVAVLATAGGALTLVLSRGASTRSWSSALMSLPLALLVLTRLVGRAERRRHGPARRRRGATGWEHRRPDPAQMLLLLAQPAAPAPQTTTLSAWLGRRRRRDQLELAAGEGVAVTGPHAQRHLTWWCAQVVATGQGLARYQDGYWRLWWGQDSRPATARLAGSGQHLPSWATAVRPVPPRTAPPSQTWAVAATALIDQAWRQHSTTLAGPAIDVSAQEDAVPAQVLLSDLVGEVDQDQVALRWSSPAATTGLEAVLGVGARGQAVADLVQHGPHALVAGTTGSGKSELLRAWLLQLACALPPERLCLVLVDYKGGSAFGPLTRLPHAAGVLTDLDPAMTARALASLEAEVRRRERLLAGLALADLAAWEALSLRPPGSDQPGSAPSSACPTRSAPASPPPRLVIVVDEFAVLASSHPQVLENLVRVAAQGRSLGLHLVLATQRPSGAVSQTVRANISLRVCLRVLDPADSRDVLGHAQAAELSGGPGRLMVTGLDEAERLVLQAPWCGSQDGVVQSVAEMVDELCAAASRLGARTWRPWTDPLPHHAQRPGPRIEPSDEVSTGIALALLDEPEDQRTTAWRWRPDQPLLVLGSPGSGRSTALASAALGLLDAALADGGPAPGHGVHLCGLPEQIRQRYPVLAQGAAGVGTVVGPEDPRRLARLWELAAGGALSGDVLVLDDVDRLVPAVDASRGPGEGLVLLETLCRACGVTGTGLVISAPLSHSVSRWATTVRTRLVLGASQGDQAAVAGLSRGVVTGSVPGRGVLSGYDPEASRPVECQVLLPGPGEKGRLPGPRGLRPVPTDLLLEPTADGLAAAVWAVGGDDAAPLPVPEGSVLVVGPAGSGRSTTLATLRAVCAARDPLVVDDLDLCAGSGLSHIEQALSQGRTVLASALTERVATSFRGVLAELRSRADLIVLWPTVGPTSQVAGVPLRAVADPRHPTQPGRGALVRHGRAEPIQVARPA
ncbi:FtsK/SpoIIIE domain-containing protein [Actinomyces faecalis]|uniref:FtsK/SpoIIIE domain-containing protein n=1 Tax=Actinomyces faecalis TaxID=2722820 RepID=UPI001552F210|nr:FtsK/SpoIIIE domain-containing protein [Actinomyces faecalis]